VSLPDAGNGAAAPAAAPPTLEITGLAKAFNGAPALRGVDLTIAAGEVHGLLGANGSGKSTLIKTIAGFHDPDAGEFRVAGRPVRPPFGPRGLRDHGISFVHQDLGLSGQATVLEHLNLDASATRFGLAPISWRAQRRRAERLLERHEVAIDPFARVDELSPVQRALVAIVRAASEREDSRAGRGLLVLDEPTVFLPRSEVASLFALLRRLAQSGSSVLLVSHDIDEITAVTDRVTVLRDGRNVGTLVTTQTSRQEIVALILGRHDEHVPHPPVKVDASTPLRLSARGLTGETVDGLDIDLRAGEVLGITGLAGSGFEELPDLLYGARRAKAGEIDVDGEPVPAPPHPIDMLRRHVVLIPADRKAHGSVPALTLQENLSVPFLDESFRGGRLRWRSIRDRVLGICRDFTVKPPEPRATFGSLSGGNQQKALIGKWLRTNPGVMLLNEPTQGVDIGARREIFRLVREAVSDGMAVLCASSDYEQLVELADRVVVLADGRAVGELRGPEITKDRLANAVFAGAPS
jgi:ribose transport system ATP-binding protein